MYYHSTCSANMSKSEYAYQKIREKILSDTFPTGTVLSIRDLSTQLDVSRTPIKDAISRLAYEGYVELYPDRPAIVSRISYTDIIEMLELRECIEGAAAFHAAVRRKEDDIRQLKQIMEHHKEISVNDVGLLTQSDNHFHLKIVSITLNKRMISALENTLNSLSRVALPISKSEDRFQRSKLQHEAIFNAILDGNSEVARWHMTKHLQDIVDSVKDYQRDHIHLFR